MCSCRVCVFRTAICKCFRNRIALQHLWQQTNRLAAIPSIPIDTPPIPIETCHRYPPDTHALCIALIGFAWFPMIVLTQLHAFPIPHWDFVYQIGMATAHNDHEMRRRHFKPTTLYCLTQTIKSGGLNSPGRHRSFSCCITRTGHFDNLSPPRAISSLIRTGHSLHKPPTSHVTLMSQAMRRNRA